ncbi:MAG: LysR family transcriptional regulator [Janthinobacterium lividum]
MASNTARSLAWDDFRLINAIAATGTLPAAAAALGLDHSTVFRRLRQVEAVMGTPVFERHRGGYVPTAAGVEIAALAARVDEDITAVLRRVAGQSPSPAGEVRIATSDTLLFDLVLPMLAEFKQSCPDVRLDLVTGNTALNLSRRDADVAIRATARPPETLVGRKVGRIAWAPYGPAPLSGPPCSGPPRSDPADEAALFAPGVAWVGFGDALAGLAAAAHLRGRVPEHQVACRFDSVAGLVAGVAAGLGRGFLPCIAGDRHPGLVRLGPPLAGLSADLWLLTHPDLRHVPRVRVLLDFLGQRMATLRPRLEGVAEPQVT